MNKQLTQIDKEKFGPWAIVTGASSGIGKEFARQLAASHINVVLVARRLPLLQEIGHNLTTSFGIQVRPVGLDLTDDNFLEKITAATADLDIGLLVSNAGTGVPGAFLQIDPAILHQIVQLNVTAHLKLVHHFGQRLAQRGRGGILLVSAMGAAQGIPYMANDAATKAYVISLGEGLHVEFKKLGLHMTVLLPGPTETPVLDKFGLDPDTLPMKPMPVAQCVAEGLAALKANKATHLSGRLNRVMNRLIPTTITRQLNEKMLTRGIGQGPRTAHL